MKKIWNGVCVGLGFLFFCLRCSRRCDAGTSGDSIFAGGSVFLCEGLDSFSSVVCWYKPLQTLYRAGGET